MKKYSFLLCLSVIISAAFLSCGKKTGGAPSATSRDSYLSSNVWALKSATSIDSLSSGILHSYKGTPVDSLIFLWVINTTVDFYAINYNIAGVNTEANISYSMCDWFTTSHADTTIAYDTVFSALPWKPNYSDTLFISKVSPTTLVLNVRYTDSTGIGMETDTFYRIRGMR